MTLQDEIRRKIELKEQVLTLIVETFWGNVDKVLEEIEALEGELPPNTST